MAKPKAMSHRRNLGRLNKAMALLDAASLSAYSIRQSLGADTAAREDLTTFLGELGQAHSHLVKAHRALSHE